MRLGPSGDYLCVHGSFSAHHIRSVTHLLRILNNQLAWHSRRCLCPSQAASAAEEKEKRGLKRGRRDFSRDLQKSDAWCRIITAGRAQDRVRVLQESSCVSTPVWEA